MEIVTLDTSVVIKWYRQQEILAEKALDLRQSYLRGHILVVLPWLTAYELANVLRYKSNLTTMQVQEAVQSLYDMGLGWADPSSVVLQRAIGIACQFDTTVYDAIFAAHAEELGANFITADERLAHQLDSLPHVRFLGDL